MIMPRGQQLLLPANPWFIFLSLASAQLLNMVLNMVLLGNAAWAPDFLAVVSRKGAGQRFQLNGRVRCT
jgi:rod shape-determining protein MreD